MSRLASLLTARVTSRLLLALPVTATLPACPASNWQVEADASADAIRLDAEHPIARFRVIATSGGRGEGSEDRLVLYAAAPLEERQILHMSLTSDGADPVRHDQFLVAPRTDATSASRITPSEPDEPFDAPLSCDERSTSCVHTFDVAVELVAPLDSPQGTTAGLHGHFSLGQWDDGGEPPPDAAVTLQIIPVR